VIISVVCLLVRCLLSCLTVLTRHQVSKDAELLVRDLGQVPDQGPGGPVHQFLRCRVHRGGHQDRGQSAAGTQGERDLRKDHRGTLRRELFDRLLVVNEHHLHGC
jgi:hypothetical protein